MIVRLISKDGREIKEIKENSGNCSQECKKRGLHGIPGNVALILYSENRSVRFCDQDGQK
jgi:hypothetical protein